MSKRRSFSFSRRLSIARPQQNRDDENDIDPDEHRRHHRYPSAVTIMSPDQHSPTHSHKSLATAPVSSPTAASFWSRGHSRYPSSTSSIPTSPESPSLAPTSKTALHDLVEEPSERDDLPTDIDRFDDYQYDEPLCICDTPFCQHREYPPSSQAVAALVTPPEWIPGDDYFSNGELPSDSIGKRRRSGELGADTFTSRLSRHFPSLKKRFPAHRSSNSVSSLNLRSGPPSRSSSLRLPAARPLTLSTMSQIRDSMTPPFSPIDAATSERSVSPPRRRAVSQTGSRPVDIQVPSVHDDPIDREELASTPLLPPMMAEYFNGSSEAMTSPLQSPTVAAVSAAASVANTPAGTPVLPGYLTPPLSAKASVGSLHHPRPSYSSNPINDLQPLSSATEIDFWAIKLGHANFHIVPEPYLPEVCDRQTCQRLQDDWEAAQVEFMRQAARISEHYGVTSQTYKLTQEKWSEINGQWRKFHKQANEEAQAMDSGPVFQPLPDAHPLAKMPSLKDPQQPSKFPVVDEQDIVGPMVRYATIQQERRPSRKPAFLKLFTDPASLLSGRSSFNR